MLVPTEELLALDLTWRLHAMARALSRRTRSPPATSTSGQWGVATQSKFLAVGSIVPWAEPGAGAVATQAYANPRYGPDGLALLRQGLSADEVVRRLTEADDGRDERQLGVVDAQGRGATYTGGACLDWAGGRAGDGYAAQGNILVSGDTVDALAELVRGERGIAGRAPARGARGRAGGRRRQAGAAVGRRARRRAGRRLRGSHRHARRPPRRRPRGADRGAAPPLRPAPAAVREDAARPVAARSTTSSGPRSTATSARLGYERLADWAGDANLEERVDGDAEIDPVVLSRAEEETMSGYEVASLADVESLPGPGSLRWTPLRKHFGITAFGINAYTATEAGQDVVEEHDEERLGHEELYVVVAGRATFVLDGDEVDVPAGLGRLPPRSEGEALRPRRGAGNDRARARRQAGPARGLGLGVLLRRVPEGRRGRLRAGRSPRSTPGSRRSPTIRRSSTTAPASSRRAGRLEEARDDARSGARSATRR